MGKSKPTTTRRKEVRKSMAREKLSLRQFFKRSDVLTGILLISLFVIIVGLIAVSQRYQPAYQPGQLVDQPIVSRVDFEAQDPEKTKLKREEARSRQPNIYFPNTTFIENTQKQIQSLPAAVAGVADINEVSKDIQKQFGITEQALTILKNYEASDREKQEWQELTAKFIASLKMHPIIAPDRYQNELVNNATRITLMIAENQPLNVEEKDLVTYSNEQSLTRHIKNLAADFPLAIQQTLIRYFINSQKVTYLYDQQASELAAKEAEEKIETQVVPHLTNTVLVKSGTVLEVKGGYELLLAEVDAYINKLWQNHRTVWFMLHISPFAIIFLLAATMAGYVRAVKPRVAQNPLRTTALACLLLLGVLLSWTGLSLEEVFHPSAFLASTLLISIILVIAYDQRFAVGITVLYCLILGVTLKFSVGLVVLNILGGMLVVGQLRKMRHRSTLGLAGLVTGVVMVLGVLVVGFTERQLVEGMSAIIFKQAAFAFVTCIMTSFFVLGMLPVIERVFKVTTGMTLLELCDMNHPLLRRLQQAAPGTYNHSCTLAILAESAADAIGADGLLCRVGAYFHDVGKMNKPKYFVENQGAGPNSHSKLSPAMSLLIIVGHVKDGIEMAREYGLPRVLQHFIESHHGTTLVEYFYHAAIEQSGEDKVPDEVEFRYPGPKPQSKEAAILMLCDCVESATRALPEKSPARIEQLVHKLSRKRLLDGQFDECDLTLGELAQTEQAITKSLMSIYHGRIAYPSDKKQQSTTHEQSSPRNAKAV